MFSFTPRKQTVSPGSDTELNNNVPSTPYPALRVTRFMPQNSPSMMFPISGGSTTYGRQDTLLETASQGKSTQSTHYEGYETVSSPSPTDKIIVERERGNANGRKCESGQGVGTSADWPRHKPTSNWLTFKLFGLSIDYGTAFIFAGLVSLPLAMVAFGYANVINFTLAALYYTYHACISLCAFTFYGLGFIAGIISRLVERGFVDGGRVADGYKN
ncbi:hypothetical protein CC78DRAFT_574570 [Lojkania enalia]|uniref:Uncharacterized protein n=1 Tax=Lojkania enalia TaxID=147567 RepID=A0A9P4TNW7_9PLEO|nr:hypothetical protein CC78DRAFT_574570 [Didymosphaeria enalia]